MNARPEELITWLDSKNMKHIDLPFISLLKTEKQISIFVQVIERFQHIRPSFSTGMKIMELATELILISRDAEMFLHARESAEIWMNHLSKIRNPITAARDTILEKSMMTLPWPFGSKMKFERRGDRAGIELKLYITSEADIIKTLSALEHVKSEMQNQK